ncbi:MAG: sugar isomerase, KpsF/GutQ family protein [Pseudomonadota bacterium]|jgi:arabinose-5-phosphate isomerase
MTQPQPSSPVLQVPDRIHRVLQIEANAILNLQSLIGPECTEAVEWILEMTGRLVVSGMGKSGHIARKLAATFASTGTPAYFVHPAEAQHGDLGMIQPQDVVMAISYSGETDELCAIAPHVKRIGARLIALTGKPHSSLARLADLHLCVAVPEEACPHNLAPTASTTATLAMGDALAIATLERRGFGPDDFARSHPGGALGRRLLIHVRDIMRCETALPLVQASASLGQALLEMSQKRMGMTLVAQGQRLVGIFTDGDLRRALQRGGLHEQIPVETVMTPNPRTISAEVLASEAAYVMEAHRLNHLAVVTPDHEVIGAIGLHDLLEAKVI